jgi:biopolymer transport protein ExbB/TolQ
MRTILPWLQGGGPFILPLLLVTAVSLALLVERIVRIVIRSKIHSRPFIEKVISLVRAQKLEEALQLCADHQAALPDLGLVILRSRSRDPEELSSVAESAKLMMLPELTRRTSWLPTLTVVTVLLGMIGAVVNLHGALLGTMPMREALAYALRPLGVGLSLALPIIPGHAFVASESRKLEARLDEFSVRLINALIDRPDVRLGHRS